MSEEPGINDVVDGRFALNRRLSQGSVGSIWSATPLDGGPAVALKLLRAEVARLPHLRRRFAREARAASRLMHPNVASIVDFGVDDGGTMFIAMELLDGQVVTDLIHRGLSLQHLLELVDQLLAGLAHAHARGVIHRDLKPANVMVVGGDPPRTLGVVKIVDFGIARMPADKDPRDTAQGEVVGTPRYMSPEQAAGERQLSPRTDLYNVGLILYELVAGAPPFGDEKGLSVMSRHVHEEIPPWTVRDGLSVPDGLEAIVGKALAKEPSLRWSSAAEMRAALMPFLTEARQDPRTLRTPAPLPELGGDHSTVEESAVLRPLGTVAEAQKTLTDENPAVGPAAAPRIPFVGREMERDRLQALVESLRGASQGALILLEGEAGVGKTRLTMWLKERTEEAGLLQGHIGSFTRGNHEGLQGLREVLDSLFGTRRLPRQEVIQRVGDRLRRWGYDQEVDVRRVADFMRPAGPDTAVRTEPMAPSKLFSVMVKILEIAAARRPRLVILDDLHWASPEVGDFLEFLAVEMRRRPIPILVMATIRSEDLGENIGLSRRLDGLSRYTGESVERFRLQRLSLEEGRELVQEVLPVEESFCDDLYERSGGNPLHLVLLLRYLRQEGLLRWDGHLWHPEDPEAVRGAVPPSLADLFRLRLEQMEIRHHTDGRLESLLARAAIVGPRFTYDVLREMVESEGKEDRLTHFDDDFDHLLDEGLLIESHGRREEWYAFSHGVVRDYFLERITNARRARRFHRLAAQAYQAVHGDDADRHAAEIGEHWEAAGKATLALQWYLRASRYAMRTKMLRLAARVTDAALRLFDDALAADGQGEPVNLTELQARCEAAGMDASVYVALLVQLGDLHEGFGAFEESQRAYRRVVRLIGATPPDDEETLVALAESWLGLGHVAWQRGDFEAARWAFERVCALVDDVDFHTGLGASARRGLARVAWHQGDHDEADRLAGEALEMARLTGDENGEARALWAMGEVARIRGDSDSALRFFQSSQDLYAKVGEPVGLARNLLSRAQVARYQKDFLKAEELYQRGLRRYQSLGHRRGAAQCLNGLGDIARFKGDHGQARDLYEQALVSYEAMGAQFDVAVVYTNLGVTALRLGDFDAAKGFLEASRTLLADEKYPYLQAGAEFNLALVEALRGAWKESSELLDRVLALSERFPIPDLDYAEPLEELAHLLYDEGRPTEARDLWTRARDIYGDLGLADDHARLAELLEARAVE